MDESRQDASQENGRDTGSGPPTEVLVHRARDGDRGALATLLERYEQRVLGVVRRRLGPGLRSTLESGDVVQEVMVEAVRSVGRLEPKGDRAFLRWMCGVVENKLRNLARGTKRHGTERANTAVLAGLATPPDVSRTDDAELLDRAIATLPANYAEVIRMRHFQQLSFKTIGERTGRTEDAAWMLHKRAKAQLAEALHSLRRERPAP